MAKWNILFAAVIVVSSVIAGSSALFWPCESNDDCTAVDSTCSLETGHCNCHDFEFVFSGDYSKCLKTSLFGDTCEDSVQCNLMPSGANCKAGVCDCADGHTYVRGRCRPLNGLEQSCETDLDCYFGYDRQSVTCQNQVCACANGYYRRNGNICRRKSMEIDDACVVDTDCEELGPNVQCKSLTCQYIDEIKTESSSKKATAKITRRETSITQSDATSQLSKSSKSDAPATASASVSAPVTAAAISPVLVNGRNDFTDTDNETDTEPQQRSREIAVQTSIDAFELKPLQFVHAATAARQVRNVATATSSTSTSRTSRRPSHHYRRRVRQPVFRHDDEDKTLSTLSNTDDDVDDRKFGSSCTENGKSCSGLPHSICSNSICLCKQGYYTRNTKCFAELGEIAESGDECEYEFDELSKRCICQKNYFYERSLRACRKPIQYHLSCTSNSQCSPYGAAFCHPEIPRRCTCDEFAEYDALRQMCVYKQGLGAQCETNDGCPVEHSVCANQYCVCKEHFLAKGDACVKGIGAICEENDECAVEDSVCEEPASTNSEERDRSCQCRKGFVHFKDECLKEAVEIEDECVDSEQCKPLLGTCIEKKCTCTPEQHFKFGRCEEKKGIGESCVRAGECVIEKESENVECRNSVCQCKFGYQADVEHKACIRVLPNKKNSSGRPSALKMITLFLVGSAILIVGAACKQALFN